MTPQNYQKLKDKIIEANKSILDLKFGCEIEVSPHTPLGQALNKKFGTSFWTFNDRALINEIGRLKLEVYLQNQNSFKILGRPIQLADVLLAIRKIYNYPNKPYQPDISISIDDLVNQIWDLTKDLDNQSEETKQFLFDLLCTAK
jgi:hypothetical protein